MRPVLGAAGRRERKLQEMGGDDGARHSPDHTCHRNHLCLSLTRLAGERPACPAGPDVLMSHPCLVEEQLFNLGAGIQRRELLSSLTAEGHCPPSHVQTGFMRGLPAPRSVRHGVPSYYGCVPGRLN